MTTTPTDQTTQPLDLDAIAARCAAATPGPWTLRNGWGWGPASDGLMRFVRIATPDHDSVLSAPDVTGELAATRGDAEFIAAARQDIPALLAEVRQLRTIAAVTAAELTSARAEVEHLRAEVAELRTRLGAADMLADAVRTWAEHLEDAPGSTVLLGQPHSDLYDEWEAYRVLDLALDSADEDTDGGEGK